MIDMDLIKLQKRCKATCVIIQDEDIQKLDSKISINANCEYNDLFEIFKEKISKENEKYDYFVIEEIDEIDIEKQEKFYQIVKDRKLYEFLIPDDVIIVLTVRNKDGLKKIAHELYHLCVVAF